MHTLTKCSGSYGMSLISGGVSALYPAGSRGDIRKKRIRFMSTVRNRFLRDDWIRRLAQWMHYQMIFIDESAANELTKDRKHVRAPIGVRPTEYCPLKRSKLWYILPAYTSRGYIAYEIVQGSITKDLLLKF